MLDCPQCKSVEQTKDGIVRTLQRYKYKGCGFRFTVVEKLDVKSADVRRLTLEM